MDFSVRDGWSEGQAVFVANKLRNLSVNFLYGFGIFGKVGASAGQIRYGAQVAIGLFESVFCLLKLFQGASFTVAKRSAYGDAENADVTGLQPRLQ
jgi:hypothetical protein